MKKSSLRYVVVLCMTMLSLGNIGVVNATMVAEPATLPTPPPPPEVQKLLDRVEEIQRMDISKLSTAEKKELRSELKNVKKELKATNAIYIPIGTAIIILILLLLLL